LHIFVFIFVDESVQFSLTALCVFVDENNTSYEPQPTYISL